jgi:ornithine carbamoyltransferase
MATVKGPAVVRHFLDLFDLTPEEAHDLLDRAIALKSQERDRDGPRPLASRILGLLFEKPSLRTRVSFEAAIAQLGGSAIFLQGKDVGLGVRETVADFARVISRYVDVLAVRTYAHATVAELARHATVPVINALCDTAHPCQAMADLMTVREAFGRTAGVRITFVGDGNNVARSLAVASALLGARFTLCAPPDYRFPAEFVEQFAARFPEVPLVQESRPEAAVEGADVVYTDVWASMGQEAEADARRAVFAPYRVGRPLMDRAAPEAIFLHCLPAHRGEEVTDEVLDSPRSLVIPQAENRLHFQKELLVWLLLRSGVSAGTATAPGRPRPRSRRA